MWRRTLGLCKKSPTMVFIKVQLDVSLNLEIYIYILIWHKACDMRPVMLWKIFGDCFWNVFTWPRQRLFWSSWKRWNWEGDERDPWRDPSSSNPNTSPRQGTWWSTSTAGGEFVEDAIGQIRAIWITQTKWSQNSSRITQTCRVSEASQFTWKVT